MYYSNSKIFHPLVLVNSSIKIRSRYLDNLLKGMLTFSVSNAQKERRKTKRND